MSMRYLWHIVIALSFCTIFSFGVAYAGAPDIHSDEFISGDEKDAAVDGLKEEYLGDDEIDLHASQTLKEEAAELDENIEFEGEKEAREKESKTVYKYNKELPQSTDEKIPRLWIVPKR